MHVHVHVLEWQHCKIVNSYLNQILSFKHHAAILQNLYIHPLVLIHVFVCFLFHADTVGPVMEMNYCTNCTSTTVHWQQPFTLGQLNVSYYYYKLIRNQSKVDMGMTTDTFVSFSTSTLQPNFPGYSVLVWAHAPPGNGTSRNLSVIAAKGT